jgi:hypothetical protein
MKITAWQRVSRLALGERNAKCFLPVAQPFARTGVNLPRLPGGVHDTPNENKSPLLAPALSGGNRPARLAGRGDRLPPASGRAPWLGTDLPRLRLSRA